MTRTKRFYQFVIPSIGAMMVTGLYFIVDGIFGVQQRSRACRNRL